MNDIAIVIIRSDSYSMPNDMETFYFNTRNVDQISESS